MSLQTLKNPLDRLSVLPTTMNWRGLWVVTEQYFIYDTVVSPSDGGTYILTGQKTILGGLDPSASGVWTELSATTTGLASIQAGAGITITYPYGPTTPLVNNAGVITLDVGDGIENTGTATNPVLQSTGVRSVTGGYGIAVGNTAQNPTLTNTGVRNIVAGVGVSVSAGNNPTLTNTGVIGITAGNAGIGISGTTNNPIITNTGLASLAVGAGLSTTGGLNPTIENTGVLTVAAADATITVTGTAQSPTIAALVPSLSLVAFAAAFAASGITIAAGASGSIFFTPYNVPNIFNEYLANGSPDPLGVFMIDLSSLNFINGFNGVMGAQRTVSLAFQQVGNPPTPTKTYTSTTYLNQVLLSVGTFDNSSFNFGKVYFNVAEARAAGLTTINSFLITNGLTGGGLINTSVGNVYAEYYPNGLE